MSFHRNNKTDPSNFEVSLTLLNREILTHFNIWRVFRIGKVKYKMLSMAWFVSVSIDHLIIHVYI